MPKQLSLKDLESKINQNTGTLDLSMLKLTDISFLKKLKNSKIARKITVIDLSDNKLVFSTNNSENNNDELNTLNALTIDNDKIFEACPIPDNIRANVTNLNLANNQIENIPSYFGLLKNLVKLDLYGNNLKTLNVDIFGTCSKLNWLDITSNENLDEEGKNVLSPANCRNATAANAVDFFSEKYNKIQKLRIKKRKKLDKQTEKNAKEKKLRDKEERRRAYDERIRLEEEQALLDLELENALTPRAENSSEEGSDLNHNSADSFLKTGEKNQDLAKIGAKSQNSKCGILCIFSYIFTSIYSLISGLATYLIWYPMVYLVYQPVKLTLTLAYKLLTISIKLFQKCFLIYVIALLACKYVPALDSSEVCNQCAILTRKLVKWRTGWGI